MSKYCSHEDIIKAKSFGNSIVGLIHPSDFNEYEILKLNAADFLIVGSIEEKTYYQTYKKMFLDFLKLKITILNIKNI